MVSGYIQDINARDLFAGAGPSAWFRSAVRPWTTQSTTASTATPCWARTSRGRRKRKHRRELLHQFNAYFWATVKKDLQDHHQPPEWILVHAANGIVCALKYCLTCARYNWDNTLNLSWLASTKMYAILWPKWQSIFKLPTLVPRNPIGTLSLPLKLL